MVVEQMKAEGLNGIVLLFPDHLRITRKGIGTFFTHGLKGDKDIQLSSISSIQFKNAGMMSNGYIQFAFLGGRESKGGILTAVRDENTVTFKKSQRVAFETLRDAVQVRLAKSGSGTSSSADEIEKLASLRDKGIVTEEEFEAKKKQLLGL